MLEAGALLLFRAFGLVYVLGGAFGAVLMWRMRQKERRQLELQRVADLTDLRDPERFGYFDVDVRRRSWLLITNGLTLLAGAAMALASWLAVPLLATLVLQQGLYFLRQRGMVRAAKSPEEAAEARPDRSAAKAAWFSLVLAGLSVWLLAIGKLG